MLVALIHKKNSPTRPRAASGGVRGARSGEAARTGAGGGFPLVRKHAIGRDVLAENGEVAFVGASGLHELKRLVDFFGCTNAGAFGTRERCEAEGEGVLPVERCPTSMAITVLRAGKSGEDLGAVII